MNTFKPICFDCIFAPKHTDNDLEINPDGTVGAANILMVLGGLSLKEAREAVYDMQTDHVWIGNLAQNFQNVKFLIRDVDGRKTACLTLEHCIKMVMFTRHMAYTKNVAKALEIIKQYIKEADKPYLREVMAPPDVQMQDAPTYLCKLHNKPSKICKACVELFKEDPEKYPCPKGICPLHFEQKQRCKGCNKKSSSLMCKLHNQRKVVCTVCTDLFRQDPGIHPCPTGICKIHLKRKARCACKKVASE